MNKKQRREFTPSIRRCWRSRTHESRLSSLSSYYYLWERILKEVDDEIVQEITRMSEGLELNVLDGKARVAGLVLMSTTIFLALGLAVWTGWCRKSPPVMAMQPVFLTMLAFGIIVTNLAIIPLSMDESTTTNLDVACMSYTWLNTLGATFILSAFFSKLWRINKIFTSAEGFRRKAVMAKDVIWPFTILFTTNILLLVIVTTVDPRVWDPEGAGTTTEPVGCCTYEGTVGEILEAVLALVNFVALIFVIVQAYKARNIRSEYSDSRGILFAVFSMFQGILISFPSSVLIEDQNKDATYVQLVVLEIVTSWSILFFIFGPVVAKHRKLKGERVE